MFSACQRNGHINLPEMWTETQISTVYTISAAQFLILLNGFQKQSFLFLPGGGRTKGTASNFSVSVRSRNRRKLKKAKTKTTNADSMLKTIAAGDRLVVETLCTNSWVDVVWQVLD